MRTNAAAHPWRTSPAWSAVFRAAGLSIFVLIAWLWLFSADGPAWRAVSLVAAQALAALAGVAWYLPRARAERRWRAAPISTGNRNRRYMTAESKVEPEAPLSALARVVVDVHVPTLIMVDEQHRPIGSMSCLDVLAALARCRVDGAGG
jgi:CBS-domain-containing membrane protein